EVHPRRGAAAINVRHAEADDGIWPSGEGIAMLFRGRRVSTLMHDRVGWDVPGVGPHVGQQCAIAAPPVALLPAHLLLCNVLGDAVGHAGLGAAGEAPDRRPVARLTHVQLAVTHESKMLPRW